MKLDNAKAKEIVARTTVKSTAEVAGDVANDVANGAARSAGPEVFSGGSLQTLLTQALISNDENNLRKCLEGAGENELVVQRTVERLPTPLVLPLVQAVVSRLNARPWSAIKLANWIKFLLLTHTSYLLSVPDLERELTLLYQNIDYRLHCFKRLLKLQGKLDIILTQVRRADNASKEKTNLEPALTFFEHSVPVLKPDQIREGQEGGEGEGEGEGEGKQEEVGQEMEEEKEENKEELKEEEGKEQREEIDKEDEGNEAKVDGDKEEKGDKEEGSNEGDKAEDCGDKEKEEEKEENKEENKEEEKENKGREEAETDSTGEQPE